MVVVDANAGGRNGKRVRGSTIVVRVERKEDLLSAPLAIAPRDQGADGRGIAAEHARADVQRVIVVGEAYFGVFDRRCALCLLYTSDAADE